MLDTVVRPPRPAVWPTFSTLAPSRCSWKYNASPPGPNAGEYADARTTCGDASDAAGAFGPTLTARGTDVEAGAGAGVGAGAGAERVTAGASAATVAAGAWFMRHSAQYQPAVAESASKATAAATPAHRLSAGTDVFSGCGSATNEGTGRFARSASAHARNRDAAASRPSSVVNRASATVKSSSDANGGRSSVPVARAMSSRSAPLARYSGAVSKPGSSAFSSFPARTTSSLDALTGPSIVIPPSSRRRMTPADGTPTSTPARYCRQISATMATASAGRSRMSAEAISARETRLVIVAGCSAISLPHAARRERGAVEPRCG